MSSFWRWWGPDGIDVLLIVAAVNWSITLGMTLYVLFEFLGHR